MGKLSNKVAVVTGASKGIGAAIAKQLAKDGASVVVNYASSKQGADKVVAEIKAAGGNAVAIGGSVADNGQTVKLFEEAKKTYGKIDILINNAGVYAFVPLEEITAEEYARQYNTNVLGLLQATREAVKHFPAEGGSVVNISSIASTFAPPTTSIYSGTKGAVDTITKVLAKELAPKKIRVNAINPGYVVTEGTEKVGVTGSPQEEFFISITPLGRAGQPEDIALPTAFLVSDDARWITGEIIKVGGGAGI
ncbi:SDR family NAD(P)-dependent oxidoreductase [Terriglobus albidus]|uniref:SDR family NAD(P)-dependent oxidoreductase n=1 Tax=Terriglobus albidus TaxID=1592106 RepID=UPI0021DFA3D8|nr:glucose 1-dehydrogenase [Terriglobus albidus]